MVCFRAHHQRSASHSGVRGRTLVRQDRAGRGKQADDFKLSEIKLRYQDPTIILSGACTRVATLSAVEGPRQWLR